MHLPRRVLPLLSPFQIYRVKLFTDLKWETPTHKATVWWVTRQLGSEFNLFFVLFLFFLFLQQCYKAMWKTFALRQDQAVSQSLSEVSIFPFSLGEICICRDNKSRVLLSLCVSPSNPRNMDVDSWELLQSVWMCSWTFFRRYFNCVWPVLINFCKVFCWYIVLSLSACRKATWRPLKSCCKGYEPNLTFLVPQYSTATILPQCWQLDFSVVLMCFSSVILYLKL